MKASSLSLNILLGLPLLVCRQSLIDPKCYALNSSLSLGQFERNQWLSVVSIINFFCLQYFVFKYRENYYVFVASHIL